MNFDRISLKGVGGADMLRRSSGEREFTHHHCCDQEAPPRLHVPRVDCEALFSFYKTGTWYCFCRYSSFHRLPKASFHPCDSLEYFSSKFEPKSYVTGTGLDTTPSLIAEKLFEGFLLSF